MYIFRFFTSAVIALAAIFSLSTCNDESEPPIAGTGYVRFSFEASDPLPEGGLNDAAFFSYTIRTPDGCTLSDKVHLYYDAETGLFMQPLELPGGDYALAQFFVLNSVEELIYASPLNGSSMSDQVQHPLSMPFQITVGNTTDAVAEVLPTECHTASDFGYETFGFAMPARFSLEVSATLAELAHQDPGSYTLQITAKGLSGNVEWSDEVTLPAQGNVCIPAYHARYTFTAVKDGYISHEQHFLKDELTGSTSLSFEFIPESLEGFTAFHLNHDVTVYLPDEENRCRLYARVDIPEGYRVLYGYVDKSATTEGGFPLGLKIVELFLEEPIHTSMGKNVNLFGNKPFASATDFCSTIDLTQGSITYTLDEVAISSFVALSIVDMTTEDADDVFLNVYQLWE